VLFFNPCLQDALADRDLVHRQTAATVVQHLALGVAGLSCEDALTHLLNFVWPNVFEDSPHLINGVMGAIDGCRLALGPCVVLHYTLQVRERAAHFQLGVGLGLVGLVIRGWIGPACQHAVVDPWHAVSS
jgi:hypothetical protein